MQTPNCTSQSYSFTGPRTDAGKRRSRRNSLKHGLRSRHLILDGENPADLEKLRRGLREDLKPEGFAQEEIFEQIVNASWRLRRIVAFEHGIITRSPAFVGVVTEPNANLPRQILLRGCLKDGTSVEPAKAALLRMIMGKLFQLSENVIKRGFDFVEDMSLLYDAYGNFDVYSHEGFCAEFSALMSECLENKTPKEDVTKSVVALIDTETLPPS